MEKRWKVLSDNQIIGESEDRKERTKIVVKQLLKNRRLEKPEEIKEFLNPKIENCKLKIENLFDVAEIEKAVRRIREAIKQNQLIIIHGDYDVDGICGTAILWETIYRKLGYKNVQPFIPSRFEEGYGLSIDSIDKVQSSKFKVQNEKEMPLLITTDCGISAADAIDYAKSLGIDVIVTDHHTKSEKLPNACAILHTEKLSSAGIAYLLTQAVTSYTNYLIVKDQPCGAQGWSLQSLDLVALATIADLQPLLGVNRTLTKFGLEELNRTQRIGLKELIRVSGLEGGARRATSSEALAKEGKTIGPYEVGWMLAPRLNAAGRLENALDSLRLLCTKNPAQAWELAQKLNHINAERQQLTQKSFEEAKQLVTRDSLFVTRNVLVLNHQEWHEGVIGLVAAKIVEEYYRPTIAIAKKGGFSKGSARSIKEFNIIETIRECQDLLVDAGGHPMAAGFTIETSKIEEFTKRINEVTDGKLSKEELSPTLRIDTEIELDDITWELLAELKKFEPFGIGNPKPVFLTKNVEIAGLRLVGKGNEHLKMQLSVNGLRQTVSGKRSAVSGKRSPTTEHRLPNTISAIGFGLGHFYPQLDIGDKIDIVYTVEEDTWNDNRKLQLKLKDLRKSENETTS